MNGRYRLADTPEERIAIAVVSALHRYFVEHPQGVAPGQHFLSEFLKPFLERETTAARLDELMRKSASHAIERRLSGQARELELGKRILELIMECDKRVYAPPADGER